MAGRTSFSVLKVAITAVFTALVTVATVAFSVYVPATRGYFNIGETAVYVTALLFGPLIGAFAGGVGSMFADILLGYSIYAPGTLLIKACEGAIVGFLSRQTLPSISHTRRKVLTLFAALSVGLLIGYVGISYYAGSVEASIGWPPTGYMTASFFVPYAFWIALGVVALASIVYVGFRYDAQFGVLVFSVLAGGLEMAIGYFLYEQLILGVAAVAEVPVNIGQMTVGLIVSIPVVRAVWARMPSIRGEFNRRRACRSQTHFRAE
jgi:uncharacterized membrane protein